MPRLLLFASLSLQPLAFSFSSLAWSGFLDGSALPGPPWQHYSNEGSTIVVGIDESNFALRMDSSDRSGAKYNEWYVGPFVVPELVAGSRFRLVDFTATGKENLLSVTVGGGMPTAPSITLVDGRFKVWSYTTDQEIFDLGPAVANEFHTAYILARNNGTAQIWWDGAFVINGTVPATPSYDGYVEFGSGTYWQTTAATTVDFDWVGFGDANDLPQVLKIERAGNRIVLFWPSNVTEFVLQCSTNLAAANWIDVLDTPGNTYTTNLASTSQFYRLRREIPPVVLRATPLVQFRCANSPSPDQPGDCDCNNPAHWDGDILYVFNSAGHPWRSSGPDLFQLNQSYLRVAYNNQVNGGRWIESTWKADDGVLYGWYHFEPAGLCPGRSLTAPRIGALRSLDNGATWQDLGIILDAPPNSLRCNTANFYFAGGNGDFSVIADGQRQYFYFFISTYTGNVSEQGVAVARMLYADRDNPVGKVWKWHAGNWSEPGLGGRPTPIFAAAIDWHQANADALWGPSIHWNTYLQQYVILLNRAIDANWAQEGIYVTFNSDLANPTQWTRPKKILGGLASSQWYPQVVGPDKTQRETDKLAGQVARLFVRGASRWEIRFLKPGESQ